MGLVCDESQEFSLWLEIQFIFGQRLYDLGVKLVVSDGVQFVLGLVDYFMVRFINLILIRFGIQVLNGVKFQVVVMFRILFVSRIRVYDVVRIYF